MIFIEDIQFKVLKVKCHLLQQHLQAHPQTRVPLMSQPPLLETLNSPVDLQILMITLTKLSTQLPNTGQAVKISALLSCICCKNCVDITALSDAILAAILFADVMLPD